MRKVSFGLLEVNRYPYLWLERADQLLQKSFLQFLVIVIVGMYCPDLMSQAVEPSAGQLLQQNRDLETLKPKLPELTPKALLTEPKPSEPTDGQMTFVVKNFVFSGNTKISNSELLQYADQFLNKAISFDDLNRLTDVITERYRAKGWLVRVVLPQQDITDGTVKVTIIEATLGSLRIDNQSKSVSSDFIERWVYSRIPRGAHLSLDELEAAILTLDDFPDITVASSLEGGSDLGETVVALIVQDKAVYNAQLSVDNFGDKNSGRARYSAMLNANGVFGAGHQASLYGMHSQGTDYGRLSYTLPVSQNGLRLGVNGSHMSYKVLGAAFQSLNPHGISNTSGIEATYPILRSRPTNLVGTFNWNHSQFKNWNVNGLNADQTYSTSVAQLGVSGNSIDAWMDGGLNTGSIIFFAGNIGRNPAGDYNTNYKVANNFYKFRYAFTRQQTITDTLSFYLSLNGQRANKNMDSSEQMYLGGATSVRAYNSGQGAASQGHLTTFELRQNLPHQTQLIGFYDIGHVQTWKFNNPAVNSVNNNYVLQGYGLGLIWFGPYGSNLKATWARRSGSLESTVSNHLTQNGGLSTNRIWVNFLLPI